MLKILEKLDFLGTAKKCCTANEEENSPTKSESVECEVSDTGTVLIATYFYNLSIKDSAERCVTSCSNN